MKLQPTSIEDTARLALRQYTSVLDQNYHYIPYFYAKFGEEVASLVHCEWDFGDATGRYLAATILCRQIIGQDEAGGLLTIRDAEEKLKDALRWMFGGREGLVYRPAGLEWANFGANMFDQRSTLLGLVTWYLDTGDAEAYRYIVGIIRELRKIGVQREGYLYLPMDDYLPGMAVRQTDFDRSVCADPCHYGGGVHIYPLVLFYEKTGNADAKFLIENFTRFILYHADVFEQDGSFWAANRGAEDGHFHSRMATVAGILQYALMTGDEQTVIWCKKVFRFACEQGTSYGVFPEGLGEKPAHGLPEEYAEVSRHTEICCTTDMIHIALLLAEREPFYYDVAERFLNQILACQLKDVSWVKPSPADTPDTQQATYWRAADRYRGAFTARTTPNDMLNHGEYSTMACCVAAGGRGLKLLWDQAAVRHGGDTVINLWLTMHNEYVQVECRMPVEGYLKIRLCCDGGLKIRVPGYLQPNAVSCRKNGETAVPHGSEHWLYFSACKKDDVVELRFPCRLVKKAETYCGIPYEVSWIGNRVVGVSPEGPDMPLYIFEGVSET